MKNLTRHSSLGNRKGCNAGIRERQTLLAAGTYRHVPETEARGTYGEVSGR